MPGACRMKTLPLAFGRLIHAKSNWPCWKPCLRRRTNRFTASSILYRACNFGWRSNSGTRPWRRCWQCAARCGNNNGRCQVSGARHDPPSLNTQHPTSDTYKICRTGRKLSTSIRRTGPRSATTFALFVRGGAVNRAARCTANGGCFRRHNLP